MDKNQYFEMIYEEYFPKIYDYMRYRIRNPAVAEELAEDVFIAVYKNLHVYDENRSFIATWLYAIRKLPKRNRQIVYMKYYHNMTSREIGKIMNLSSCNVRIILKRSLSILRKQLRREGH